MSDCSSDGVRQYDMQIVAHDSGVTDRDQHQLEHPSKQHSCPRPLRSHHRSNCLLETLNPTASLIPSMARLARHNSYEMRDSGSTHEVLRMIQSRSTYFRQQPQWATMRPFPTLHTATRRHNAIHKQGKDVHCKKVSDQRNPRAQVGIKSFDSTVHLQPANTRESLGDHGSSMGGEC
jgi:hypothetical protein